MFMELPKNHLKIKKYKPEIILQIESLKGINNLENILSNKFISGTLIGDMISRYHLMNQETLNQKNLKVV